MDIGPAEAETILQLTIAFKRETSLDRIAALAGQVKTWPEVGNVTLRFAGEHDAASFRQRADEELRDKIMTAGGLCASMSARRPPKRCENPRCGREFRPSSAKRRFWL
jgi:hypothetical protein